MKVNTSLCLLLLAVCVSCNAPRQKVAIPLNKFKIVATNIRLLKELQYNDSLSENDSYNGDFRQNAAATINSVASTIYSIEGYYYRGDSTPLLVSDLRWTQVNTAMPDSVYVKLSGTNLDGSSTELDKLQGSYIRCDGRLALPGARGQSNGLSEIGLPNGFGDGALDINFSLIAEPEVLNKPSSDFKAPATVSIDTTSATTVNKNYALLYAGCVRTGIAYPRYWNDLKFMYSTLKQYGYADSQIVVVFKDGRPLDKQMPVNFPASVIGFNKAVDYLSKRLDPTKDLFLFVTNHGGGYLAKTDGSFGPGNYGGIPKSDSDNSLVDQTTFYFQQPNNLLSGTEFAAKINALHFKKLVGVFEQCFGGGFLSYFKGNNRVLVSAATDAQFSHAGGPGDFDLFSYFFTVALNTGSYNGASADLDNDGKISLLEAFLFAKSQDHVASETPLLEDNGDGLGTNNPQESAGQDGYLAKTSFMGNKTNQSNAVKRKVSTH